MTDDPAPHPYLSSYRIQHARIFSFLSGLMDQIENGDGDQANLLKMFFAFAAEKACGDQSLREELFLFNPVSEKSNIRAGGPLCMLYFDMHLSSPPLERAARACGRARSRPTAANVPAHLRDLYERNSPACIPAEDHQALSEILRHAETCPPKDLVFLAVIFLDMLKLHFEKEDNCLIPMCQTLLTSEEWDFWAAKCAEWENKRRGGRP
jgi:hypothetical protein